MSRLRDIAMHAIVYAPDANGGPGLPKMELDPDMLNCAWTASLNGPGQAVFTLSRYNRKLSDIDWMVDHIKLIREDGRATKTVFSGKLVKPSYGPTDVVCTAWDYLAFLQRSRTGYRVAYPKKQVGTEIVQPEWNTAKTVNKSPLEFVSTGTIQNPLADDDVTPITVNDQFGVILFDRLFLFFSLAEMAMANTVNNVVFEITREAPHTFNFWKNRSSDITKYAFTYPGNLVASDFNPGYDELVVDISTVIKDGSGGYAEYNVFDQTLIDTYRRLQGAFQIKTLVGSAVNATEEDQQKAAAARLLKDNTRLPRLVVVSPFQGYLTPFDGWDLGDCFRVTIQNDRRDGDELDGYLRAIGLACAWSAEGGELVQLYLREKEVT